MSTIILGEVEGCKIFEDTETGRCWFTSDCDVDGDGANGQSGGPPCYAPRCYPGPTLDDLACAGHPGNWWGVVTDTGKPTGSPLAQCSTDPAPGAFISCTSLRLLGPDGRPLPEHDPKAHVDAATVPFIVLPLAASIHVKGRVLGCLGSLTFRGVKTPVVVADKGPTRKIGEASPAACRRIGINPSARSGGVDWTPRQPESEGVLFEYWPGVPALIDDVKYPLQSWAA